MMPPPLYNSAIHVQSPTVVEILVIGSDYSYRRIVDLLLLSTRISCTTLIALWKRAIGGAAK